MLTKVTAAQMQQLLLKDHPDWDKSYIAQLADKYVSELDSRLDDPLSEYIATGTMTDFKHDEYSLLIIRAIRNNCSYLSAVLLMDAYIKDHYYGKLSIQRRI